MASRKKIIIIEDLIILNDMLKKIISNNYDVVATSDDANNLITLCEKYNPDIVLTDICTKNNSNGIINGKKIKEVTYKGDNFTVFNDLLIDFFNIPVTRRAVPSMVLSAILPENPSETITSA